MAETAAPGRITEPNSPGSRRPRPKRPRTIAAKEAIAGRLFTFPALITLVGLVAYPIVYGFVVSFFDTNLLNRWDFVGAENYVRLGQSGDFLQSIITTVGFAVLVVGGNLILGTFLALLVNQPIRFRLVFRVILILPWLFPEVVVALIWKWMYHPLYGLFNSSLQSVGLNNGAPVDWLGDPNLALFAVALTTIWKGYPLVLILVLAGLSGIPRDLYEAAELDGAGKVASFRYVTLPQLRPVFLAVLVLETIWWFKHFTIVWLLTSGGPAGATNLVSIDIYLKAFQKFQWGSASAAAVVVLLICMVISATYRKVLKDADQ